MAAHQLPSDPAPASEARSGPTAVAIAWLAAYRFATYTEPATAWITRVVPYVTAEMNRANHTLLATTGDTSGGAAWVAFVDGRCTATVTDVGAVIPTEAPRTVTVVHVQVAGTLITTCASIPAPPDEALAATLTVVRTTDGWRVDHREN